MYEKMKETIASFEETIKSDKLKRLFDNCFYNALDTTIEYLDDGSVYMLTGDIPAMWLRDSSASVLQYIEFAKEDEDVFNLIKGLIKRQFFYISIDPYANSFNRDPNGHGHTQDEGERTPYTWERKFEIDSLCYPIWLIYKLYKVTGRKEILDSEFVKTCKIIIDVFKKEQKHHELSDYYHYREGERDGFNIPNHGHGGDIKYTGMIWSGYRPSDDACKYGYFIPGNMFAVVALKRATELLKVIGEDDLAKVASDLAIEVDNGIKQYGIINHEKYGEIYAYEVDGLGNYLLMDDANVPSLLSIPCFEYEDKNSAIYKNTRKYCLSFDNPYYFEGKVLKGIGSPHTPKGYVWHMGIVLEALTSGNNEDVIRIIKIVMNSDNDTYYTHEGINKDDQSEFTRSWFAWSNSLFSYLILKSKNIINGGIE